MIKADCIIKILINGLRASPHGPTSKYKHNETVEDNVDGHI
jgi:hypothetical protein